MTSYLPSRSSDADSCLLQRATFARRAIERHTAIIKLGLTLSVVWPLLPGTAETDGAVLNPRCTCYGFLALTPLRLTVLHHLPNGENDDQLSGPYPRRTGQVRSRLRCPGEIVVTHVTTTTTATATATATIQPISGGGRKRRFRFRWHAPQLTAPLA